MERTQSIRLDEVEARWKFFMLLSRYPALNPAFAIAEVVWILCGRNEAAFLNYWNSQLPKYAGNGTEYYGAYGYRLRHHFGMDQLERAYLALRHNSNSRQVVLQIWDPTKDFPDESGLPVNPDIPCNITSLIKIREGKLEWMQIMRSNDLFRGVPYNFIQFTSLQEILAGWLNVEVGSYNQISDSLHLYRDDAKSVNTNLSDVVERNTDSLCLPKEESDAVLDRLNHCIEAMIVPNLSQEALNMLLTKCEFPSAYHNLLLVVGAEAARKRGWLNLAKAIMVDCSNPMLTQAWERWLMRFQLKTL